MSLVFTTTSCDMDLTPDSAVPEHEALRTIDDCDAWVVGIYSAFKNSALYSGYMTLLPDIQADMAYAALNTIMDSILIFIYGILSLQQMR